MENDERSDQKEGEPAHNEHSPDATTSGTQPSRDENSADRKEHSSGENSKILREWLTIAGLFLAAAAAIYQGSILARQANLLQGQLGEMHEAGIQTDKLIKTNSDLAAAAKAQAIAAQESAKTAHDALLSSQRARIATISSSLDNLQAGQPIKANLVYSNIGHEGAPLDIRMTIRHYNNADWNAKGTELQISELGHNCTSISEVNGTTIAYPFSGAFAGGYTNSIKSNDDAYGEYKFTADDDMIKGQSVLVFTACLSYRTLSEIHHTSACFYYKAGETPTLQNLNICRVGNYAD